MPVKEVPGASETISEWEKATRQNDLTDCKEGTCVSFENVKSNELGACLVPVIDGQRGAPIRCDSLLFHEDGVDYIRVISGTTTLSFSMGRPDFKFTVYIPANESSKIVLDAFSDALQSTPLSLKTRIGSSYVIGTSSFGRRQYFILCLTLLQHVLIVRIFQEIQILTKFNVKYQLHCM